MSNEQALNEFEAAFAGFPATMSASLTYIARIMEMQSYVVKARLHFHGAGTELAPKLFVSDDIVAERFELSTLSLTPRDVIKAALEGKVITPQGEFAFLPQAMGGFAATFIPLHPEVLAQQTRTGVLQIRGTDQADHCEPPRLSRRQFHLSHATISRVSRAA